MTPILEDIKIVSEQFDIETAIVAAICQIESAMTSNSARYEDHYRYLKDPKTFAKMNRISIETEIQFQKTSWGIMQVMGGVCRESGYNGFLPQVCETRIGLTWGCIHLQKLMNRHSVLADAVASYNAGSPRLKENGEYVNQEYVNKFFKAYDKFGGKYHG